MKKLLLTLIFLFQYEIIFAQQEQAYPLTTSIWRSKAISVCWDNPTNENSPMRELVRQAVKDTWEKNSALKFTDWVPASEKDADIHIYIAEEGPHTKGLGNKLRNKPQGMVLNFTFGTWSPDCRFDKEFCIKTIAVHEFGHALGFAHEQNRADCKFKNCFNKEQGSNGDWYLTQCDINSVMNYCNPTWSNDGILSQLDIQALQYFYGKPGSEAPTLQPLKLVHTSNQIGEVKGKNISHEFKIYIVGSDKQLENVKNVVYHLHRTFKPIDPVRYNDKSNNYGLGITVWGQFQMSADVYFKDGTKITLGRYLDFKGTGIKPNS